MNQQPQPTDSGLAALILVAGYHGIAVDPGKIIHEQAALGERFDNRKLLLAAKKTGFKAKTTSARYEKLPKLTAPYIAEYYGEYIVILKAEPDTIVYFRPGLTQSLTIPATNSSCTGTAG